jgi:iron complex transport system substrate-binding protein
MIPRRAFLAAALASGLALAVGTPSAQPSAPRALRIVSLVPAVTEILFAVGAGPQIVAVSSFDRFPPAVEKLPRVGALLDPDTERIFSLKPNLVVVYGSQADLQAQFKLAGIAMFVYRHGGLSETLDTIGAVGAATGHAAVATKIVTGLRARLDGIRKRVAGRPRPRTLLVLSREPGTLRGLYASGGIGFLHDLLELAGGSNVFADAREESVQPSHETMLTRRPDVVLELYAQPERAGTVEARRAWSALASVPAVRAGRVHPLGGAYLVTAGPRLADAAETLARTLHPSAF